MGNLTLNGATSGQITIAPPAVAGTNTITLPASTGTLVLSSQVLTWQSVQTTGFTAVSNRGYPCNTTSAAFTVTLPASPTAGDQIIIVDYAGTAGTNNITISGNGNKINGVISNALISTNRQSQALVYVDSTQGWVGINQQYANISFSPYTATYLSVAGGGAGGSVPGSNFEVGGGGGAGGYLTSTFNLTPLSVYTITIGAGGTGAASNVGTSGNNSSISGAGITTVTSIGGGRGGGNVNAPASGGSGGGGEGYNNRAGASGTVGQGNSGGTGENNSGASGGAGGGGASAVGGNGSGGNGGAGGAGTSSSITGASVAYAGGGGGSFSANGTGGNHGAGGNGGGGAGGGNSGTANTGGGGGGNRQSGTGGNGGSGVVILSVPTANYSGITTGSPTITTSGSNTILKFTASGSYTA